MYKYRDQATQKLVERTPQALYAERASQIRIRIAMYYTNYMMVLKDKKDELQRIQDAKDKQMEDDLAFAMSLFEFGLNVMFAPAIGSFSTSKFVTKTLGETVGKATADVYAGLVVKHVRQGVMAGAEAALKPAWLQSQAGVFLDELGNQQQIVLDTMQSNLGDLTESELYATYLSFDPAHMASKKAVGESVDEVYNVWDKQIKGLGWQWRSGTSGLFDTYFHGIVEIDWDTPNPRDSDFKYPYEEGSGHSSYDTDPNALSSLKANPYLRIAQNKYGNLIEWRYEGYIDPWVYPGKKSFITGETRHQLGSDDHIGLWKRDRDDGVTFGPDYRDGGCDGKCCKTDGPCCKTCALVSRSVNYSDLFGRPGGWGCASDRDCYGGPPKYNNEHPEGYCGYGGRRRNNRICCVDKNAHASYGLSWGWCVNSPAGFPCDDADTQCRSSKCVPGTAKYGPPSDGRRRDGGEGEVCA